MQSFTEFFHWCQNSSCGSRFQSKTTTVWLDWEFLHNFGTWSTICPQCPLAVCRLFWMVLTSLFLCSTLGNFVSEEKADGISQWITHTAVMFYSSQQGHFLFYLLSWLFVCFPAQWFDGLFGKITEIFRADSLMLRMPVSVILLVLWMHGCVCEYIQRKTWRCLWNTKNLHTKIY